MKDPIAYTVRKFLKERMEEIEGRWKEPFRGGKDSRRIPLIVGWSGGADSSTILEVLTSLWRWPYPIDLHIAHVDHSWREGSDEEAKSLERRAESMGIAFHFYRIEELPSQNIEEYCREERLAFFQTVYQNIGAQALILGHHMDDQAETVLKRILEGASPYLGQGMREVSSYEKMEIWRPLLSIRKKAIRERTKKKKMEIIDDSTNRDTRFLRARMREKMIPSLEEQFGKGITKPLMHLSESTHRIEEYLRGRIGPYLNYRKRGEAGWQCDCSSLHPHYEVEIEFLLRYHSKLLAHEGYPPKVYSLSKEQIRALEEGLMWGDRQIQIEAGAYSWRVDGHYLFICEDPPLENLDGLALDKGTTRIEDDEWIMTVTLSEVPIKKEETFLDGWEGFIDGCLRTQISLPLLPKEELQDGVKYIAATEDTGFYPSPTLKSRAPGGYRLDRKVLDRFRRARVPKWQRGKVPYVTLEGAMVGEFLSGEKVEMPGSLERGGETPAKSGSLYILLQWAWKGRRERE